MLFLSYFKNLSILYNIVSLCILAFGLVGTVLPYIIRVSPAPAISDYLNSFRQVRYRLKRFVWPSPIYSRRWFLKGLAFGAGSAFLVTIGVYILLNELIPHSYSNAAASPLEPPTDTPTPEPGYPIYSYHGHTASVYAVACSPSPESRQVASAGADRTVQVWNWDQATPATGKPIIYYDHTDTVNGLAWSPDGQRIASASTDRTVKVWEVANQNTIFTYTGHTARVNAVAWSPNSKYVASASDDHTVQIFEAATGKHIYT
jgi:WD40 repeat protein